MLPSGAGGSTSRFQQAVQNYLHRFGIKYTVNTTGKTHDVAREDGYTNEKITVRRDWGDKYPPPPQLA